MNWAFLGAIADTVGAIAILVTLIYLAVQLRQALRQRELESLRHTWDNLNEFCDAMSQSVERADLVVRGRANRGQLNEAERLVFDHLHLHLLNSLEAWQYQLEMGGASGETERIQRSNLKGIIASYFGYPGTLDLWREMRMHFEPLHEIFETTLEFSVEADR